METKQEPRYYDGEELQPLNPEAEQQAEAENNRTLVECHDDGFLWNEVHRINGRRYLIQVKEDEEDQTVGFWTEDVTGDKYSKLINERIDAGSEWFDLARRQRGMQEIIDGLRTDEWARPTAEDDFWLNTGD